MKGGGAKTTVPYNFKLAVGGGGEGCHIRLVSRPPL